jgi:N-acetylmuramoyl-L-alanine amidase
VIDIQQSGVIKGLPLSFSGKNLVSKIRTSHPSNKQSIRLVFEVNQPLYAKFNLNKQNKQWLLSVNLQANRQLNNSAPSSTQAKQNPFKSQAQETVTNTNATSMPGGKTQANQPIVVAIDAGHGGQDPGAIGQRGLKEKNVTFAIATKLLQLLRSDPMFKGVMTRNGDYFISVRGRSEVARKENANMLISIHADSAPNHTASGASVWVLSNRRANSEMANWLEQTEKQSELLGGAGDLLASNQSEPYLRRTLLDLQFGHSQQVGYDVALKVLQQLRQATALHKRLPEHASLGVLRSPDIPSLLVETGFISNLREEKLLGSSTHQAKIAQAIYLGLKTYFRTHPYQIITSKKKKSLTTKNRNIVNGGTIRHRVVKGDSLTTIAAKYQVSTRQIIQLNKLKTTNVMLGQTLIIRKP